MLLFEFDRLWRLFVGTFTSESNQLSKITILKVQGFNSLTFYPICLFKAFSSLTSQTLFPSNPFTNYSQTKLNTWAKNTNNLEALATYSVSLLHRLILNRDENSNGMAGGVSWWKYKKAAIRKQTFFMWKSRRKSFRMYVEAYEQEDYALWAV